MAHRESVKTQEFTYTALFEPAEEGGYTVTVPALPGVVTEGDTLEEARAMVTDAVQCYLESLRKDGLPLPAGKGVGPEPPRAETVTVHLKTG